MNWTWKKTPDGFVGLHGRAKLYKKGRKWFLEVDREEYELQTPRPSFDHAEGLLQSLGKTAYDYSRRRGFDYDRRAEEKPDKTITVTVSGKGDGGTAVLRLLRFLKTMGDWGTSRTIDCEGKSVVGFDGDGPDKIKTIMVDGEDATEATDWEQGHFKEVLD